MVELPDPDELIKIVSQTTFEVNGNKVVQFELDVYAVNDVTARTRARRWVRTRLPSSKNFLNPKSPEDTEQSRLRDFFTDSINFRYRKVTIEALVSND
jgi:hypothetical protein